MTYQRNNKMDKFRAYAILGIDKPQDITIEIIKRQYKKKALQYHPDKNKSGDASNKFQEVAEAYQYLSCVNISCVNISSANTHRFNDDDLDDKYSEENIKETLRREFADIFAQDIFAQDIFAQDIFTPPTSNNSPNYTHSLFSFLENVVGKEIFSNVQTKIFNMIIQMICTSCEPKVLELLRKLDTSIIQKIYTILESNQEVFHFSETFLDSIKEMIDQSGQCNERIILYTFLEDLMANNLYRLMVNGSQYIIPLWHHELVYDSSGSDLYVQCIPILPDGMILDENNNLVLQLEYTLTDLWGKSEIEVDILGKKSVKFRPDNLKLCKEQTLTIVGEGISKINTTDIYDVHLKSDIILCIHIINTI